MTPNILKENSSLPKGANDPNHPRNNPAYQPNRGNQSTDTDQLASSSAMDGDHSAKTMDKGANLASNTTDMADGIHEDAKQTVRFSKYVKLWYTDTTFQAGAGQKETGHGTSMFDANQGAVGSAFHKEGSIGQIGEKIGGPLASDGMIGKFDH